MHFAIPDPQSMEASTTITVVIHGSILERVTFMHPMTLFQLRERPGKVSLLRLPPAR